MSQKGHQRGATRLSAMERRFVRDKYGVLSIREIAEQLGKSKSAVGREVKSLREAGEISPERRPPKTDIAKAVDGMPRQRLVELADTLRSSLVAADERNVARIAAEYRATLLEIQKADEATDGGGKAEALANLLDALRP